MEKIKILCYNVDDRTVRALSELVVRLGVKVVSVPAEAFSQPIAVVASGLSIDANPLVAPTFKESVAVFVSMPDVMLDVVLSAMREKGIRISLKAILTPYNASWDANTLYAELLRDRAEIKNKK